MSADHDIKAIILANAEGRLSDEAAQAAIEGVIVDSSRKSTLSAKITSSHWIILFDARRGEHCLNRAFEVAAAVDGPHVVEGGRLVGRVDHRVSRVCQRLQRRH